jgi:hypothetical protein
VEPSLLIPGNVDPTKVEVNVVGQSQGGLRASPTNVRLGCAGFPTTNTLAFPFKGKVARDRVL